MSMSGAIADKLSCSRVFAPEQEVGAAPRIPAPLSKQTSVPPWLSQHSCRTALLDDILRRRPLCKSYARGLSGS